MRIRAKRGHQIAAVALARKLTVLCWHLLTREQGHLRARPALVAKKTRDLELRAGLPQKKGNRRGAACVCNVTALRPQEAELARQAEKACEQVVSRWKTRPQEAEVARQAERTCEQVASRRKTRPPKGLARARSPGASSR